MVLIETDADTTTAIVPDDMRLVRRNQMNR